MIKILFVCHGNICRSTMAQFLFSHIVQKRGFSVAQNIDEQADFFIDSAATSTEEIGNDVDRRTAAKLKEHGIPCGKHRARQVTKRDYELYDLILIMDRENEWGIRRIIRNDPEDKIHLILEYASDSRFPDNRGGVRDVADPWYTHNFEMTYQDLLCGCEGLADHITQSTAPSPGHAGSTRSYQSKA